MQRKRVSYAKWGYIFAAPFLIAFLVFTLYPLVTTLIYGFTNYKGLVPGMDIQLLDNPFSEYKKVFKDKVFIISLKNTFIIWGVNFVPQILLALVLAVWFTSTRRNIKGQGFFKVVLYMPNIITAATIAILFQALFAYPKGPINDLLLSWGVIDKAFEFNVSGTASKCIVAFIQFWQWYGYTMIVLIAGILGISPELFEAAEIDGANGFQQFWYVTLPNLKSIMLFTLVTSMIGGLNMFDIPKLFANGGPNNATRTAALYIHDQAFANSYRYNRASAASMILFIIIAIFSALVFFMLRDKDEAKLNKIIRQQEKEFKRKMKEQKLQGGGN